MRSSGARECEVDLVGRRPGIALMNVLMFTFITTVFLIVGIQFSQSALKSGRLSAQDTQAYNVAMAGINHAVYWLQKQSTQPVLVFDPQSAPAPDEEGDVATAEEQLGLVSEFPVDETAGLWGRYEVGRSKQAPARDSIATGPLSPLYADPPEWTVEDISLARGASQAGQIFRVRSRGYLFKKETPTADFTLASPAPLKTMTLEGEIKRMSFQFRSAPIYSFMADSNPTAKTVELKEKSGGDTIIDKGSASYHYWSNAGTGKYTIQSVNFEPGGTAVPMAGANNSSLYDQYVSPGLNDQLKYVFGTSDLTAIQAFADAIYTEKNQIPDSQPTTGFIYIKPTSGTITFKEGGSDPTLAGGGILFVEGNLTIDGNGGMQEWEGLIFVTGNYRQVKTSTVKGAVICGGTFFIEGENSGKTAKIEYSNSSLGRINDKLGNYRLDRSTLRLIDGATGPQTF